MKLFRILLLSVGLFGSQLFGAYTEFYCDFTNGSNLNGGGNEYAVKTYTSQIVAGGWNSATGVFTVSAGDPAADGVTVGSFASVYVTAGATVATFIGRVTARDATTITVSLTAVSGTPPATDALGGTTLKVGGMWKGPNAAVSFPFGFAAATMTDASGNYPRINIKNGTTYSITAAMTSAPQGPVIYEGYTTSAGDGGRAIIDGGVSSNYYILLTLSGNNNTLKNLIFQNNGNASTAADGMVVSGSENVLIGVVVNSVARTGITVTGSNNIFVECETYACNASNSSSRGGIDLQNSATLIRCISHDNAGSNSVGFIAAAGAVTFVNCIADTNGGRGINSATTSGLTAVISCDLYNNGSDGLNFSAASAAAIYVDNSNFVNNGTGGTGYGINSSGTASRSGAIFNCGFGSGTEANTSGDTNALGAVAIVGSITYTADTLPWSGAATGDFRITLAGAKGTGRGTFTETQGSYTGTIGYPDVGAAPAIAGGTQHSYSQ